MSELESFEAVVIGSGFGGAIAAYRLRQEGVGRVLVLERGMPYPPGSFPRSPRELHRNFWDPSAGLHGLFEVLAFKHTLAIVASGLGGGSLIYANVLIEAPEETFDANENGGREWPITRADLQPRYQEIRRALGAKKLPAAYLPHAVPKTAAFLKAAGEAGLRARRADLAVTFRPNPRRSEQLGFPLVDDAGEPLTDNLHHRPRRTCTLVGECDLGCNQGAKNTLDYTYLTKFLQLRGDDNGSQIRTCCEAVNISKADDGYDVRYLQHAAAREHVCKRAEAEKQPTDKDLLDRADRNIHVVRGKIVVLAAGTFGSTRLLLASRPTLPRLSPQLGRWFSTNGDMLAFARNCRNPDDRERWRDLAPSRGPVITATTNGRPPPSNEVQDEGHSVWIQDGGGPLLSEFGWQTPVLPRDLSRMSNLPVLWWLDRLLGRISADVARAFASSHSSSAMMPLLAFGRDAPGGQLTLNKGSLSLDWTPKGDSAGYFDAAKAAVGKVAEALGGELPYWPRPTVGVTVHPLGGCSMGFDAAKGVVGGKINGPRNEQAIGEVFGCPGLFVADASVMPGPIGPNPSLTIAAVADLIAEQAASRA
jgi:cholesterol oxidase